MSKNIDSSVCPLCKQPNNCKAKTSEPCWCNFVEIPQALRQLVPKEFSMKACICKRCVEAFNANQDEFVKDLRINSL